MGFVPPPQPVYDHAEKAKSPTGSKLAIGAGPKILAPCSLLLFPSTKLLDARKTLSDLSATQASNENSGAL